LPLLLPRGSFCSFASWGVMDVMQACSRCIFPLSFDLLLYVVDLPGNFECGFPAPAITHGPDQLVGAACGFPALSPSRSPGLGVPFPCD
jgi:hypothetical protein